MAVNSQTSRDTAEAESRSYRRSPQTIADTGMEALERLEKRIAMRNKKALEPEVKDLGFRPIDAVRGDSFDFANNTSGGGAASPGLLIYWQDGTTTFVAASTILENRGSNTNWSVDLDVSALAATKTITYSSATALYDNTGSSQTAARIPVYRNDKFVATYGAYQEGLRCVNGELVVEFYKI